MKTGKKFDHEKSCLTFHVFIASCFPVENRARKTREL